ncbi:MAG: site-specific integrase [Oligoflexia bacterium]|nr:site-specific integrase [Oligoflexia bacterium]
MNKFDKVFYSKKGIEHILKHRSIYNYQFLKIKTLVKIHFLENENSKFNERKIHLKNFLISFGAKTPSELKTNELHKWLKNYQLENNFTDKNMCHIKCQLNVFFKWLESEKIVNSNILIPIKFKQNGPPKKARVVLSTHEIRSILENAKKYKSEFLYSFLYTLIHTGARRSEVLNLNWEDIDFETNRITFHHTKNGESRSIDMANGLKLMLKDLKANQKCGIVFQDKNGKRVNRQNIHRTIKKFRTTYPIDNKNWGCHSLRHSFAFNFLKNGGEMYQLKAILGHKTITMTVDLYGNIQSHDISNPSPYDF